jgi:hypothetical protein
MKLYHGTTVKVAATAPQTGLLPRALSKISNWSHTVVSHSWLVYLSKCYAPYFGLNAAKPGETSFGLIEVETDLLREVWLRPDEDFIEQATRSAEAVKQFGIKGGKDIKKRTAWVRKNIDDFAPSWKTSVENLGNCSYKGMLPASAITKVSIIDLKLVPEINLMLLDPSISLANYKLCSEKYVMATRWCMGEKITAEEFLKGKGLEILPEDEQKKMHEFWQIVLDRQQQCVTVTYENPSRS